MIYEMILFFGVTMKTADMPAVMQNVFDTKQECEQVAHDILALKMKDGPKRALCIPTDKEAAALAIEEKQPVPTVQQPAAPAVPNSAF